MDVGSISEDHDQRTANLMKCSDPKGNTDVDAVAGSSGSSNCNAARYKLMSPAKLPISRSPCITIPPGLSPTAFLESPVLLSNMKVEPSPTTGSFCKSQMMFNASGSASLSPVINSSRSLEGSKIAFFEFNPRSGSNFVAGSSMVAPMVPTDSNHERSEHSRIVQEQGQPQSPASANAVKSELAVIDTPPEADSNELTKKGYPNSEVQASQLDHRGSGSSFLPERTSEDGYNWRKYGQKLVKGSEFPRSYYKCTHPNCEVKKLFERSPDGQIKEIMYKGTHDHPKPQPSRRLSAGSMMSMQEERCSKFSPLAGQEDKPTSMYGQIGHSNEPNGTPELSPCAANETGVEAEVPQSTRIQEDIDEDDDPFAKRRKMEIGGMDVSSLVKPIREPRVVVQTVSEVDILDDGYRWRKYGQKVVRGNPNPRSYYKCTSAGCPVRKHVERASHDPKAVITTYEGKHNHDVPCAKNSSHDTTAAATASRIRSQEGEPVSLDLGVGMTSAATGGIPNQQQGINASAALPGQPQISGSNYLLVQATPISSYPGYVNGAMMLYGSRESSHGHQGQGTVGITPVNHSSNPYQQNVGRLLMGP